MGEAGPVTQHVAARGGHERPDDQHRNQCSHLSLHQSHHQSNSKPVSTFVNQTIDQQTNHQGNQ